VKSSCILITLYRKDRYDEFGGVFLACSDKYGSREIPTNSQCEIVAAIVC